MGMHKFRELKIWQRSMDLTEKVYKMTRFFPREETFALSGQLKRCAVSVPSNISEGAGRATKKQFRYFLEISMGSCNEIQTQTELAGRFEYITTEMKDDVVDEANQIYKMILAFYNTLQEK